MKNKKTTIICSLLVTACFIPGIAGASALNAKADPTPALQISDTPYTPPPADAETSLPSTGEESFVPPPASIAPAPAPATSSAPAPASLPEVKSADASQAPALQISDEPYTPPAAQPVSKAKPDTTDENAKVLRTWAESEPRKVPVKSATARMASTVATAPVETIAAAQPAPPVVAKPTESIAWSPAVNTAADVSAKSEKSLAVSTSAPAQDTHYQQALQSMQQQIDQLAKDNTLLQQKVTLASMPKASPISVDDSQSGDFVHVKATRNVTIPATEVAALPALDAQEPKVPADVQKELDNLKAQNTALQAKVRTLDGRKSLGSTASALEEISPASGDTSDDIAPIRHDKKFSSLGDIDKEESYLEARRDAGFADDGAEPSAPSGKDFAKLLSRYKQSENENSRLGELVKNSKDQCDTEKKQLENMLFDPKVADEQQRDYVADLEKQLSDAQSANAEQKRHYELQIRLLKAKLGKRVD